MRQIYSADGGVAWIGNSAPIPKDWSTDINVFKEKDNGVQEKGEGPKKVGPTDEQIEDILTSSEPDADVARRLNMHWKTVQRIRKENGK